jgi:hypothetical protein
MISSRQIHSLLQSGSSWKSKLDEERQIKLDEEAHKMNFRKSDTSHTKSNTKFKS